METDSETSTAWLETKRSASDFLFQPSPTANWRDALTIAVNKQYAICRCQKKSWAELPLTGGHNERKVQPKNADAARRDLNVNYLKDERSLVERWRARMSECGDPKMRKNGVPAIETILTFSAEAAARIDPHEWAKDCGEFLARHFGRDNIISSVLHLDEKTPHCSAVIVPLIKKAVRGGPEKYHLSASHWLDGPGKLEKLQDLFFAEVGRKYNLERGEKGSTRKHVPQTRLYQNSNQLKATLAEAVQSIPTAQASDSPEAHQEKIMAHLHEQLADMAEAAKAGALAQQANQAAADAELRRKKEVERRIEAEVERDRTLREMDRLRSEYQSRLRDVPVSRVLEKLTGIIPSMDGNQRVFECPEYKIVVAADDWRFNFFKGDKPGGSGAISAVMQALNLDFKEALRWMAAHFAAGEIEPSVRAVYEDTVHRSVRVALADPVTIADKMAKYAPVVVVNWAQVKTYLTQTRGLHPGWIEALHKRDLIWANQYQSACFAHRTDEGRIVGASIRGTTSDYKQTIGQKIDGFFRFRLGRDPISRIAIVESPIEAISLANLERARKTLYASTAGSGGIEPVLLYAAKYGLEVIAAQNSDVAGEVMARLTEDRCRQLPLTCSRYRPPTKDWNETLLLLKQEFRRVLQNGSTFAERLRGIWRRKVQAQQQHVRLAVPGYILTTPHTSEPENTISLL